MQNQNMQQQLSNSAWVNEIKSSEDKFDGSGLDFMQEQIFATQLLMNNDFALSVAKQNPSSLRLAMYNVAAVGLTLNPNQGLAYLVPRCLKRGEPARIMLDISYRGLISIGVETGAIKWAKAELVYENDKFIYHGPGDKPTHDCDPFSTDRGSMRGGYCIAELPGGGYLVECMSKADMDKIKQSSDMYQKGFGPWVDWEDQMQLKSVAKRASKWWPKSSLRMGEALKILNEENGEGLAVLSKDLATAGMLPPPPSRDQVPQLIQAKVQQIVDRAVNAGAYEAAKELMDERYKSDPLFLSFALNELELAKNTQTSDEMEQQIAVGNN